MTTEISLTYTPYTFLTQQEQNNGINEPNNP